MATLKKALTKKEEEAKARRRLRYYPELNPNSIQNRKYLITGHFGARGFIIYHDNNINTAREIMSRHNLRKDPKNPGRVPLVVKLWECIGMSKHEIES